LKLIFLVDLGGFGEKGIASNAKKIHASETKSI
jgi:hypothetical protein